jgi:hypothetical protein
MMRTLFLQGFSAETTLREIAGFGVADFGRTNPS